MEAFQGKLYQKAKQEKKFRFYVLYDKMFVPYMLRESWRRVKQNGGSPGVDNVSIKDVEEYGVEKYLKELGEELRSRATEMSFDFLGFTIRYSRDLFVKDKRYWEIMPSKKSEQKVREKVRIFLDNHGHSPPKETADGLNAIIRGWLNYFAIEGVSYSQVSKRSLRYYLSTKLYRYFNRQSQRKCRLYRQKAFDLLVNQYGLIDPTKYTLQRLPVNANKEVFRKAVCGKTARTV